MEINDKTILRIKVPAHLYESVKEQLMLSEAKGKNNYGAGMTPVTEKKKVTPKSKKHNAPEAQEAGEKQKKAPKAKEEGSKEESKKAPKEEGKIPSDGMTKLEGRKLSMDELKKLHELIGRKLEEMGGNDERYFKNFDPDFVKSVLSPEFSKMPYPEDHPHVTSGQVQAGQEMEPRDWDRLQRQKAIRAARANQGLPEY